MENNKKINIGIQFKTKTDEDGNILFNLIGYSNDYNYYCPGEINYDLETFISYLKKNGYKINTHPSSYRVSIGYEQCSTFHIYVEDDVNFCDAEYMNFFI